MFAYAEIKGHQFRLVPGKNVKVPALDLNVGDKFTVNPLLIYHDGSNILMGKDCSAMSAVTTVRKQGKDKTILVFKKKRRTEYKVLRGQRQKYTILRVEEFVKSEES